MKDLIDYSRETGAGPMDSLINFPKGANPPSVPNYQQTQQLKEQQSMAQNSNQSNQNFSHPKGMQNAVCNGGVGVENSIASTASISASTPNINTMLLQNSINSKQESLMSTLSSPYGGGGNTVQIPSASSSNSAPPSQPNPSPFLSLTPSSSINNPALPPSHFSSRNSFSTSPATGQPGRQTHEPDPNDSWSSVQHILQEMLISSSANGVSTAANELKGFGGITRGGLTSSMEFGGMSGGITPTVSDAGIRVAINSNAMPLSGRIGLSNISQNFVGMSHHQQQDMGSRLLGTLGAVNGFSSLQFD